MDKLFEKMTLLINENEAAQKRDLMELELCIKKQISEAIEMERLRNESLKKNLRQVQRSVNKSDDQDLKLRKPQAERTEPQAERKQQQAERQQSVAANPTLEALLEERYQLITDIKQLIWNLTKMIKQGKKLEVVRTMSRLKRRKEKADGLSEKIKPLLKPYQRKGNVDTVDHYSEEFALAEHIYDQFLETVRKCQSKDAAQTSILPPLTYGKYKGLEEKSAISKLKEWHDRPEYHVDEIVNLPVARKTCEIIEFHTKLTTHMKALKDLGFNVASFERPLVSHIRKKLPEKLIRDWMRTYKAQTMTYGLLIDGLNLEVQIALEFETYRRVQDTSGFAGKKS